MSVPHEVGFAQNFDRENCGDRPQRSVYFRGPSSPQKPSKNKCSYRRNSKNKNVTTIKSLAKFHRNLATGDVLGHAMMQRQPVIAYNKLHCRALSLLEQRWATYSTIYLPNTPGVQCNGVQVAHCPAQGRPSWDSPQAPSLSPSKGLRVQQVEPHCPHSDPSKFLEKLAE